MSGVLIWGDELWRRDTIDGPLICFPPGEPLSKHFHTQLNQLGVDWSPNIETGSMDLIDTYVASGLGIGPAVTVPKKTFSPKLRVLPLDGFPPVFIGALWRGRKTPLLDAFREELKRRAEQMT